MKNYKKTSDFNDLIDLNRQHDKLPPLKGKNKLARKMKRKQIRDHIEQSMKNQRRK